MNAAAVGLLVVACVFAGGLFGLRLHRFLPETHLTKETQDVVRLAIGMLSVLTSLVLGLLIATAKGYSDTIDREMRGHAAELILLDGTLRDYGADADEARGLLRLYAGRTLRDVWRTPGGSPADLDDVSTGALLERARRAVRALSPADAGRRWLQDQALQSTTSLLRQRWQMIEQAGPSVRPVLLAIVVCWIVAIFAGFGLNAPRNATVAASFLMCAMAIGGAVFLILEMDSPLGGMLRIPARPMLEALARMEP
jgi:hypothetical protein